MTVSTEAIRVVFNRVTRGEFSALSDEDITNQIVASREYADEDVLGSAKFADAVANHAAHRLKVDPTTGGGGGQVKRKKNGPREVEFFQTARSGSSYSSTKYGDEYEQIIDDVLVPFETL